MVCRNLRYRIPETKLDREFYFFILLTWPRPDYRSLRSQLYLIFEMCLGFSVKNVIVMHRYTGFQIITFYTYYAFSSEHCQDRISIHEVNRYENGRLQNDFLFPKPLRNFYGCSVNVSGHLMEPLLTFNGDLKNEHHLRDKSRIGGIEGEILKVVADITNLNLNFRFPRTLGIQKMYSNASESFEDVSCET